MTIINRVREISASYLAILVASIPITSLIKTWLREDSFFKGQSLSVIVPLAFGGISFIFWLFYRSEIRWSRQIYTFLGLGLVIWSYVFLLDHLRGTGLNYTVFLTPLLLLMLLIKPPMAKSINLALHVFAWTMVAVVMLDQLLSWLRPNENEHLRITVLPHGFSASGNIWFGPFEYYSFAGMVGAFILVFAFTCKKWERIGLAIAGALMVLYAGQATAALGAIVGLYAIFVFSGKFPFKYWKNSAKALSIAGVLIIGLAASIAANPTLSGRWDIYRSYLALWKDSIIFGVGPSGIAEAQAQGTVLPWIHDAHNIVIDSGTKYGLVMVVLIVTFVVVAMAISLPAAIQHRSLGLAIGSCFVAMSLLEAVGSWSYLAIDFIWLMLAVISASQTGVEPSGVTRKTGNK